MDKCGFKAERDNDTLTNFLQGGTRLWNVLPDAKTEGLPRACVGFVPALNVQMGGYHLRVAGHHYYVID